MACVRCLISNSTHFNVLDSRTVAIARAEGSLVTISLSTNHLLTDVYISRSPTQLNSNLNHIPL